MSGRKCHIARCNAECRPTGPQFCEAHWREFSEPRRKYLKSEYEQGERYGWQHWFRIHYEGIVRLAIVATGGEYREPGA